MHVSVHLLGSRHSIGGPTSHFIYPRLRNRKDGFMRFQGVLRMCRIATEQQFPRCIMSGRKTDWGRFMNSTKSLKDLTGDV